MQFTNLDLEKVAKYEEQIRKFEESVVIDNILKSHSTFPDVVADEFIRFFGLTAYEWFSLIPLLSHSISQDVVAAYKYILMEQILKMQLENTIGWDQPFIRTCLMYWSQSPTPRFAFDAERDNYLRSLDALRHSHAIHPLSHFHRQNNPLSLLYSRDQCYQRGERKLKGVACQYCEHREPCQIINSQIGECSSILAGFKCLPLAGVHLCHFHGHQFLEQSSYNGPIKLNDGRIIWNIKSKLKTATSSPLVKPGYINTRENDICFGELIFR